MTGEIQRKWFQISVAACCFVGFGRKFEVCCCFCCLTIKDTSEEALGRHRGTRQVYIRHVSSAERKILENYYKFCKILQNFEPENEESVTVLESLIG